MAIEFAFQIDSTRISVQDAQTGHHQEVNNRVMIRQQDGLVLALGEAEEEARSRLGGRYHWEAEARSRTLFGSEGMELPHELQATEQFTRLLQRQSQRAQPWAQFLMQLADGFDQVLAVQGYEAFPAAWRTALEPSLQARLRLRRLAINGRAVQIPLWRTNLDFWLRRLLTVAIPWAGVMAGYLTVQVLATRLLPFLAYLLAVVFVLHYAGKVAWMLAARAMLRGTQRRLFNRRPGGTLRSGHRRWTLQLPAGQRRGTTG